MNYVWYNLKCVSIVTIVYICVVMLRRILTEVSDLLKYSIAERKEIVWWSKTLNKLQDANEREKEVLIEEVLWPCLNLCSIIN